MTSFRMATRALVAGMAIMTGCGTERDEVDPSIFKPEDASELEGYNLSVGQAAHTQHYVDHTNLWNETAYPMGKDNPNCRDWNIYDRYLMTPALGTTTVFTTETIHNFADGPAVDEWLDTVPPGYDRAALKYRSSAVVRTGAKANKCTGRYVVQWYNSDGGYVVNTYHVYALVPTNLIPSQTNEACNARNLHDIPHAWVDLYVCEAPRGTTPPPVYNWCAQYAGHWRRTGGKYATGSYNSVYRRCDTTAFVAYTPPSDKVAVAFNAVVKTGIGHAPAPAKISVWRSN